MVKILLGKKQCVFTTIKDTRKSWDEVIERQENDGFNTTKLEVSIF